MKKIENKFVIEVSNDGPLISKEIATKIFDQFFTTKEAGKGTGLGLSLSKDIIIDHKGHLEVLNDREYTTFSISLPNVS